MFDRSGLGRSHGFGAAVETIRDQAFLLRVRVYLFGKEKICGSWAKRWLRCCACFNSSCTQKYPCSNKLSVRL